MRSSSPVRLIASAAIVASASRVIAQPDHPTVAAVLVAANRPEARPRVVRLVLTVPPTWHIGAPPDGREHRVGLPTTLDWRMTPGWRVARIEWPSPEGQVSGRDTVAIYTGQVVVEAQLDAPATTKSGPVRVRVSYGICRDVCIPGWVTATLDR